MESCQVTFTAADTNPIPSTCLTAQMRFRWIMCDNDGYYYPLQCINATLCRCVDRFFGRNSTGFFPRSGNEGRCARSKCVHTQVHVLVCVVILHTVDSLLRDILKTHVIPFSVNLALRCYTILGHVLYQTHSPHKQVEIAQLFSLPQTWKMKFDIIVDV